MNLKLLATALCLGALFIQPALAQDQQSGYAASWGYSGKTGPKEWGSLAPAFSLCSTGKNQSPININVSKTVSSNLSPLQITYNLAPLDIIVDGDSDLNVGGQTIHLNDGHAVQVNFSANGPEESIVFHNDTYKLIQFHFHTPAENEINGHRYPGELHLVHQGADGKLAVIGVFLKPGASNPAIDTILKNLPKAHNKEVQVPNTSINPAALLPKNQSYYTFAGSLTTPPCAEGVEWIVMEQPITASRSQINALRRAIKESNDRPVQSLNDRKIYRVTVH